MESYTMQKAAKPVYVDEIKTIVFIPLNRADIYNCLYTNVGGN